MEEAQPHYPALDVTASFYDLGHAAHARSGALLAVARDEVTPLDMQPSLEIAVQRARIVTAQQVQQASNMADAGKFNEAGQMLLDWAARITTLIAQEQQRVVSLVNVATADSVAAYSSDDDMGSCTTVEDSDNESTIDMAVEVAESAGVGDAASNSVAATGGGAVDASTQRCITLESLRSDVQLCAQQVKQQAWRSAGRPVCKVVAFSHSAQRSPGVLGLQEEFDHLGLATPASSMSQRAGCCYSNQVQRATAIHSMQNVLCRLGLGATGKP